MSGHNHDHSHASVSDMPTLISKYEVLETAIRELLQEHGLISAADIHAQINTTESLNPELGAKIIAKAWADLAFKQHLVENPRKMLGDMGINVGSIAELKVVENSEELHNVVVCTLCSCYPRMILGAPPAWYKSTAYRSRVVREPRKVLAEFGVDVPDSTKIRVLDSTADLRYLVIPMRPDGTDGLQEEALATLVTRDSMIGTGLAQQMVESSD